MKPLNQRGFTLIELLVVIAIIALLAAILFPVFASAREKARQTSCLSNEKQLGLGILQYVQDFDETMPYSTYFGTGWAGEIYPYVKSSNVYTCPDDSTTSTDPNHAQIISYVWNATLSVNYSCSTGNYTIQPLNLSTFNAPGNTIMLLECKNLDWNPTTDYQDRYSPSTDGWQVWHNGYYNTAEDLATGKFKDSDSELGSQDSVFTPGRHTGEANYLLADGHAKYLFGTAIAWGDIAGNPNQAQEAGCYNAAGTQVTGYVATFSAV